MDLRIFTEPQQGASYDDQLAQAAATERLGFDGWFRSDHFLAMGRTDPLPGPTDDERSARRAVCRASLRQAGMRIGG